MDKPLLTIGILTYYRQHGLHRSLEAITRQFVDNGVVGKVEVLVSDDAGEGDARSAVAEFQKSHPDIRFARNETNLGFDGNVDKVFSLARGKFCWVMSDDDALRPGALKFILQVLQHHPDAAYVCVAQSPAQERGETRLFPDGQALLKEMGIVGGLVSQNIYQIGLLPSDRKKYYGNLWFHYSLALEMTANKPALLVKQLLDDSPPDQAPRWTKGGKVLLTFTNLKNIIGRLPHLGYDAALVKKTLRWMAKDLPRTVASAKLQGLPVNWKNFALLLKEYFKYPVQLSLSLVFFLIPKKILSLIRASIIRP